MIGIGHIGSMNLKATLKINGEDVTFEASNPLDLAALVRATLTPAAAAPEPKVYRDLPGTFHGSDDSDTSRNPRGLNRKLVLQALASAAQAGMLQAHAQQWISLNKRHDLAISSVRHALNQAQDRGEAMRTGDLWRITGAGVVVLAALEDMDRKAAADLEDLIGHKQ